MPPQFLYDYILFKVDVGGVTSHTREPLNEIARILLRK
jgi:hypothetical protein